MIDIELIRQNPEMVKENIRKKFQDKKLPLVDEVIKLDKEYRSIKQEVDTLRAMRNKLSSEIGLLMKDKKIEQVNEIKQQVVSNNQKIADLETKEDTLSKQIKKIMMTIPNIIAEDVPLGENDSKNVEGKRFLQPKTPDFDILYHTDILEKLKHKRSRILLFTW